MRSHKIVAYTATCLAVLGGLALAKPSVVHADTVTPATTQSADAKSTVNQDNQLKNYYNMAQKAYNDQQAANKAKTVADKAYVDAGNAQDAWTKNPTDDTKAALDKANQASNDAARAYNMARDTAVQSQDSADHFKENAKAADGITDTSLAAEKKASADADAAAKKAQDNFDAANAAHKADMAKMFGLKEGQALNADQKKALSEYEQAYTAWHNYKKDDQKNKDLKQKMIDLVKQKMIDLGTALNKKYKPAAGFTYWTYNQSYSKYLAAKAALPEAQKAAKDAKDKYTKDAGFDTIANYFAAKKDWDQKYSALVDAQKAAQDDPNDWNQEAVEKAQQDYDAADKTLSDATKAVAPFKDSSTDKGNSGDKGNTGDHGNTNPGGNTGDNTNPGGNTGYVPGGSTNTNTNANTTAETPVSGVAYMPIINGNPNWKVNMMDANGHFTNVYLNTNTSWKVFAKKTINGIDCYRLGSQQQWVPAQYLDFNHTASDNNTAANGETPVSGTARVTFSGKGAVKLLDASGHHVDQYVKKGSTWKVWAEKTVNGVHMYRIGNQNQWVPADYVALS